MPDIEVDYTRYLPPDHTLLRLWWIIHTRVEPQPISTTTQQETI